MRHCAVWTTSDNSTHVFVMCETHSGKIEKAGAGEWD